MRYTVVCSVFVFTKTIRFCAVCSGIEYDIKCCFVFCIGGRFRARCHCQSKKSTAYQAISQKIKEYTTQVDELRLLAAKQQNANLITKSERTLEKVEPLLIRIDDLYQRQSTLPSESTVCDKFGLLISYITSAALELMSWLLVLVSNALKRSHAQLYAVMRNRLR